jgi:hypothetical protein
MFLMQLEWLFILKDIGFNTVLITFGFPFDN